MVITDPIADLLMRLRNAGVAGKTEIDVPHSDLKLRIANVLMKEGYVASVEKKTRKGKGVTRVIAIGISYDPPAHAGAPRVPRVRGTERISRPSRRLYAGAKAIKSVHQGHGVILLSTPKGIMTGEEARKENVGGEILCKIW